MLAAVCVSERVFATTEVGLVTAVVSDEPADDYDAERPDESNLHCICL